MFHMVMNVSIDVSVWFEYFQNCGFEGWCHSRSVERLTCPWKKWNVVKLSCCEWNVNGECLLGVVSISEFRSTGTETNSIQNGNPFSMFIFLPKIFKNVFPVPNRIQRILFRTTQITIKHFWFMMYQSNRTHQKYFKFETRFKLNVLLKISMKARSNITKIWKQNWKLFIDTFYYSSIVPSLVLWTNTPNKSSSRIVIPFTFSFLETKFIDSN